MKEYTEEQVASVFDDPKPSFIIEGASSKKGSGKFIGAQTKAQLRDSINVLKGLVKDLEGVQNGAFANFDDIVDDIVEVTQTLRSLKRNFPGQEKE